MSYWTIATSGRNGWQMVAFCGTRQGVEDLAKSLGAINHDPSPQIDHLGETWGEAAETLGAEDWELEAMLIAA